MVLLLMPLPAFGQIVENFESGNTDNWIQSDEGRWIADSSARISGSFSLHHSFDNPGNGIDCIGMPLADLHPSEGIIRWSFSLRHGYDPSSLNNWAVFLMSDSEPSAMTAMENISGFAAGVNITGYDDTLRLWKVKQGEMKVIITCPVNWQTDVGTDKAASIIVERAVSGYWSISVYIDNTILKGTATGFDNELFLPEWFGVIYRYSSTRDRLLWFDDLTIDGVFYEDKIPPSIIGCRVSGTKSLEITMNEELSGNSLLPGNYALNDINEKAVAVNKKFSATYRVEFGNYFNNKILNNLLISHLCDKSGNCSDNIQVSFTPVWPETGDVVISEIMADPLPVVSLPGEEYLEITNRTGFTFNLSKWELLTEGQNVIIPEKLILPGEAAIICSVQDTVLFSKFGKVIGLKSFPALTDDGRIIVLKDSLDNMIHGVEYSSDWYGDELKAGGGWSLEMIDTDFPFYSEGNWEASESRYGGTPGAVNSVSRFNPDNSFSGIENVFPVDSVTLDVRFSETVLNLTDKSENISLDGNRISTVTPADPLFRHFIIKPEKPLLKEQIYTLNVPGTVTDAAGNTIARSSFRFGIPVTADKGDMVFNELLFNPLPDDPDYIELFNCSAKVIDASRLFLASVNDDTGDTSQTEQVAEEHRCILPGSYYAVTADRDKIISRYYSSEKENIFNAKSLPSMADDKGHLILFNPELVKADEVLYDEEMHYSLLAGTEGVSLEKVRPQNISADRMNWHSASESSGWGTPGAPNSVFVADPATDDRIIFSSGKISPDNDGFEDILIIDFNLTGIGNVLKITVFDETGTYVHRIADNFLAGPKASVSWDGTAADGTLVNTGIYILLIELYDDKGKTRSWKKVCTVIR
ncbi:MAG: lamin tail domain-containing protein [Bacteroidales bacterium]|nr:lamin tail domain-containing protein [Bacteroidales bacterium]